MSTQFQDTLTYLYERLPMFQRVGNSAIKKDLTNTFALCEYLGNPQKKFEAIHVAGTNGKGSSSHMLSSVLQEAGYHTGLYTSPHLKHFTERIKINGYEVPETFVVDFVENIKPKIEEIRPSFFELTVAMAFHYFAEQKVDIAVIEVGMGGRLDSTNVITPLVSLITNIGMDHADMLGDTLGKIAFEKAGIIKPNVPVVVSEYQDDVAPVFKEIAIQRKSQLFFADQEYRCVNPRPETFRLVTDIQQDDHIVFDRVVTDLGGVYQTKNIPGVIKTLQLLPGEKFVVSENEIRKGLASVKKNTGLKGRWQVLDNNPLIICDTGHNEDGIREVVRSLKSLNYNNLFILFGMVKDKDAKKVLSLLPKEAKYYFCEPEIPRKLAATDLSNAANEIGIFGRVVPNVNQALSEARDIAKPDDLIFIGGSNFIIADLENL